MECCCLSWVLCDASVSWPERGRAGVTSWTAQSWSRDRGYLWGVAPKTVCKQGSVSVCSSTFFPLLFSIILIMSINISYYSDSICWIVNEIYCPIAVVLEEDLPKLERFFFPLFSLFLTLWFAFRMMKGIRPLPVASFSLLPSYFVLLILDQSVNFFSLTL